MNFLHLSRNALKIELENSNFPWFSLDFSYSSSISWFSWTKTSMILSLEWSQHIIKGACWFLQLLYCTHLYFLVGTDCARPQWFEVGGGTDTMYTCRKNRGITLLVIGQEPVRFSIVSLLMVHWWDAWSHVNEIVTPKMCDHVLQSIRSVPKSDHPIMESGNYKLY